MVILHYKYNKFNWYLTGWLIWQYYSGLHMPLIWFYVMFDKQRCMWWSLEQVQISHTVCRFLLIFLFCILWIFKLCFAFCFLFSSNHWRSLERYEMHSVLCPHCEEAAVCHNNCQHHVLTLCACVCLSSDTVLIPESGYCFFVWIHLFFNIYFFWWTFSNFSINVFNTNTKAVSPLHFFTWFRITRVPTLPYTRRYVLSYYDKLPWQNDFECGQPCDASHLSFACPNLQGGGHPAEETWLCGRNHSENRERRQPCGLRWWRGDRVQWRRLFHWSIYRS